jgi:hypothetical protein
VPDLPRLKCLTGTRKIFLSAPPRLKWDGQSVGRGEGRRGLETPPRHVDARGKMASRRDARGQTEQRAILFGLGGCGFLPPPGA